MLRHDEEYGRDPPNVHKTGISNRQSENFAPIPSNAASGFRTYPRYKSALLLTCDFFIEEADAWRGKAWDMIRRCTDCTSFIITKRPKHILKSLPADWDEGWTRSTSAVPVKTSTGLDESDWCLPVFLQLSKMYKSLIDEPMQQAIDVQKCLKQYSDARNSDGSCAAESVSYGGESGPKQDL